MRAYVYPGQGSQFEGMGKDEYDNYPEAKEIIDRADHILDYPLSNVMFGGSSEALKQTRITQPAIFVHSLVRTRLLGDTFVPEAVAGHSLGEFSALTAAGALSFEDGLRLVAQRAEAMQEACEMNPGTMAAVVGLEDEVIERICDETEGTVVPANYNCPGQLVISGELGAVQKAVERLQQAGAKRAMILEVGGAFHSPLMAPAQDKLHHAIDTVTFSAPVCPVYQNSDAKPSSDPDVIKQKLISQLTSPVLWTQTVRRMIDDGLTQSIEVGGKGRILSGLLRRIDRNIESESV